MREVEDCHSVESQARVIAAQHDWLRPHLAHLTSVVLAHRVSNKGRRFVVRLTNLDCVDDVDAVDVVLKAFASGDSLEEFERCLGGHQKALDNLGPCAVPEILSIHPETRSLLMRHIGGRTAHDMLGLAELGLAKSDDILEACGRWIGRFHRSTLQSPRPIDPNFMLRWVATMRSEVMDRSHDVPRRDLFMAYVDQIPAMAEAVTGEETPIAVAHGDLHLRNLLITEKGALGLDFDGVRTVTTAHDLAKFLVRFHGWFDADPDTPALDPFWRGYGGDLKDLSQPALRYILPIRLLGDWRDIPKQRTDRRSGQQHRFRNILKCAEKVFRL
ncbi:Phosphotransferase enzyme family protein [Aliiroseovarius halocynthiae]|uniref:Aminoglycoside phosphotransferase family protein n=1 Tax=Aliiroseovarius halocynthiae TaxID=985055 RepID=A0A545SUB1_9RHOB|nr:aminoglycoside phosphotransferase family protein [Aliiroseovarius halocynthiae]TQV68559.1 aminoglycoside phosphotransferase family protein [Aliiroseovarius halocynthiae]SMR70964.1 Phosphotransferase enzyme family protein [Aliiroseovarius halocynthiae]